MSNKIVIPEGMLAVATEGVKELWDQKQSAWNPSNNKEAIARAAVFAALEWLSENPIAPSRVQVESIIEPSLRGLDPYDLIIESIREWQRRMFLAPEPEIPEIWMPFVRNAPLDAVSMTIYGANESVLAEIDLEVYRNIQQAQESTLMVKP